MVQQYLALGDSYTIGEGVALFHSFPYKLTQALRQAGLNLSAPEVIAKTGWTTKELHEQLNALTFLDRYDLVTLLIGVNDQYRGYSLDRFEKEFHSLFTKALSFTKNPEKQLVVFSIPDWGLSPFAKGRLTNEISTAIDAFNHIISSCCNRHHVTFVDVTRSMRGAANLEFVDDGLHPAPSEYSRWVSLTYPVILNMQHHA